MCYWTMGHCSGTESSKFHQNCGCFWSLQYTPWNQNVHYAVSSNDQYQRNSFFWPPRFRPNWSIGRRVIAFPIFFQHGGPPPSWILKILIFDHATVIAVLTCCCVPNFIKIGSRESHAFGLQTPITAECSMRRCQATPVAMATASWRTCRDLDSMRPPKFRSNRSIGRRVMAFQYFRTWRPSASLNTL